PDAGDLLRRRRGEEIAEPLDDRRIDAGGDELVEQRVEAAPPRPAQLGRLLERIDQGAAAELAGDGGVDAAVDAVEGRAPPAGPAVRLRPAAARQRGAAAGPRAQLDQAHQPLDRPLVELAQHAEALALDPLERVFLPGDGEPGLAQPAETADARPPPGPRLV